MRGRPGNRVGNSHTFGPMDIGSASPKVFSPLALGNKEENNQ